MELDAVRQHAVGSFAERIMRAIVDRDWEFLSQGARPDVDCDELFYWVDDLGVTPTAPQPGWEQLIDPIPIQGRDDLYFFDVPLWTLEEGRSDLSLECYVTLRQGQWVAFEVCDIHIM